MKKLIVALLIAGLTLVPSTAWASQPTTQPQQPAAQAHFCLRTDPYCWFNWRMYRQIKCHWLTVKGYNCLSMVTGAE